MPDSFKFYPTRVTATSYVSVVSGLTGTRIVNAINVANASTSNTAAVSVQVLSGTNSFSLVPLHTMSAQISTQLLPSPIALTTSDDIQAAATSGSVDVIVSALERTA